MSSFGGTKGGTATVTALTEIAASTSASAVSTAASAVSTAASAAAAAVAAIETDSEAAARVALWSAVILRPQKFLLLMWLVLKFN